MAAPSEGCRRRSAVTDIFEFWVCFLEVENSIDNLLNTNIDWYKGGPIP